MFKSQLTFHMTNSQHGIWPVWWLITWPWDIVNQLWVKMLKTSKETILTCSLLVVVNILSKWLCHQNQPRHQSLWMSTSRSGRKRNLKWTWNNNHLFKNNDLDTSRDPSRLAIVIKYDALAMFHIVWLITMTHALYSTVLANNHLPYSWSEWIRLLVYFRGQPWGHMRSPNMYLCNIFKMVLLVSPNCVALFTVWFTGHATRSVFYLNSFKLFTISK